LVINIDWVWFESTAMIIGAITLIYLAGKAITIVYDHLKEQF